MKRIFAVIVVTIVIGWVVVSKLASSDSPEMVSPDGNIRVVYDISSGDSCMLQMSVASSSACFAIKNVALVTSDSMRLVFKSVSNPVVINDDYLMIAGKRSRCTNEAVERTFTFADQDGVEQNVIVRVYNDGVAFRYELPDGGDVAGERSSFDMSCASERWLQSFEMSYEGFYKPYTIGSTSLMSKTSPFDTNVDTLGVRFGFPSLFKLDDEVFALLTEADVHRRNSAASLWNDGDRVYRVAADENVGHVDAGWQSPWRVAIVGSLADVVESTLVTDVCEPSKIEDTSWIKPGVASWIYWAYNHGSNDYQIVKEYIDMAVSLRLPYVLIDAEWDEMTNGGTIEDAISYANANGVKALVWYNSSTAWVNYGAPGPFYRLNKPEDREKEFSWLESMGVAGVKIDFFETDKLSTMEYCIDLLECAAKHHLTVNFHGATLPRGWQRTYPNLVSTEAVYGAEWYNNGPVMTNRAASHNATLPFIRGVVGPMDYTPCTFTDSQHPHITSDAHELALTVLFESAVLHLADRPSSYLSQPQEIKYFLSCLPTTWDDTKLISGYPGHSVVLARCKNDVWYVAGINGLDEMLTVNTDLSSLPIHGKSYTLIQDGDDGWNIAPVNQMPSSVSLKPRGGFVAIIK